MEKNKKTENPVTSIIYTAGKANNLMRLFSVMRVTTIAAVAIFTAATLFKAFKE